MKTILLSPLLLMPSMVFATPAPSAERTVNVAGKAMVRLVPDTVLWSVSITANHKDLVQAKRESDKQMKDILKTTRQLGVQAKDVQTGQLTVEKEYEGSGYPRHRRKFLHYVLTRQIHIKQRGTERFDDFLTGLIKNRDMTVSYQLTSSDLQVIQAKARIKAVLNAKTKATAMAKALGAKLGPVLRIEEAPQRAFHAMSRQANTVEFAGGAVGSGQGTFAPGSIEVTVSVGVQFALR